MKVFTARSTGISITTGVLAVGLFGQLMGAPWGLAILNGLTIGAVVLLVACAGRLKLLFQPMLRDPATMLRWRPQLGVWMVTWTVFLAPTYFAMFFIELDPATEAALTSLFFATFTGAYLGGMVGATLEQRDRIDTSKNRHSG